MFNFNKPKEQPPPVNKGPVPIDLGNDDDDDVPIGQSAAASTVMMGRGGKRNKRGGRNKGQVIEIKGGFV